MYGHVKIENSFFPVREVGIWSQNWIGQGKNEVQKITNLRIFAFEKTCQKYVK